MAKPDESGEEDDGWPMSGRVVEDLFRGLFVPKLVAALRAHDAKLKPAAVDATRRAA